METVLANRQATAPATMDSLAQIVLKYCAKTAPMHSYVVDMVHAIRLEVVHAVRLGRV